MTLYPAGTPVNNLNYNLVAYYFATENIDITDGNVLLVPMICSDSKGYVPTQ